MTLLHIAILALVQGLTEFLPVSSSGHLVLVHAAFGVGEDMVDQAMVMDVAVHVGTLIAALVYFRRDVFAMARGVLWPNEAGREGRKLFLYVVVASVPIVLAGLAVHMFAPVWLRSVPVMAGSTIIFAVALWAADKWGQVDKTLEDGLTLKNAVLIGLAQAVALIPGTSRSGITMTAARALGFSRVEAARFSLLLATVAISGAGVLGGLDLWQAGDIVLGGQALLAMALAFLSGWASIALMMRWLERHGFLPFVIYRLLLGIILLFLI